MVLLKQQWRADRWAVFTWCIVVAFLTWMASGLYQVLNESGLLTQFQNLVRTMPPAFRALFGAEDFNLFGTFVASIEYNALMAIAFMIFVTTYVPGLISKEVDQRSSEFLLSLPVKRSTVLVSRWLSMALSMAAITVAQWVTLLVVTGEQAQPVRYLWASINMYMLFLQIGTLLLLVSIFVDDYPRSAAVCAGLVVLLFFYHGMTEEATGFLSTVRRGLPFARFNPDSIIGKGVVPLTDMALLAFVTVVLLYLGVSAFDRKQIAG
ncbi:MAG: ABC transporter permease subunit [Bacillota bacterium]